MRPALVLSCAHTAFTIAATRDRVAGVPVSIATVAAGVAVLAARVNCGRGLRGTQTAFLPHLSLTHGGGVRAAREAVAV